MVRRGIYPGTFDPFHNGHLDLIQRGLRLVDELVVAIARNLEKTPLFTVEERLDMIREATAGLRGVPGTSFPGLLGEGAGMGGNVRGLVPSSVEKRLAEKFPRR